MSAHTISWDDLVRSHVADAPCPDASPETGECVLNLLGVTHRRTIRWATEDYEFEWDGRRIGHVSIPRTTVAHWAFDCALPPSEIRLRGSAAHQAVALIIEHPEVYTIPQGTTEEFHTPSGVCRVTAAPEGLLISAGKQPAYLWLGRPDPTCPCEERYWMARSKSVNTRIAAAVAVAQEGYSDPALRAEAELGVHLAAKHPGISTRLMERWRELMQEANLVRARAAGAMTYEVTHTKH